MRTVKSEEEQVGKDEDDNDDDDDDDDDALGGVMYWSKYSPLQKLISVQPKIRIVCDKFATSLQQVCYNLNFFFFLLSSVKTRKWENASHL